MTPSTNPIRQTDDEARALARALLARSTIAALAFSHPDDATPFISRIGLGRTEDGALVSLLSDLALHTRALRASPRAALLIGEPGSRGDPLNSPRLSLSVRARFVARDAPQWQMLRKTWLAQHPKSKLYVDFADFGFVVFAVHGGALYGGFGRAYALRPDDIA